MKCSECPKQIPAARLQARPHVETCSTACSAIRQGDLARQRSKSYNERKRKTQREIPHHPLTPDTEPVVRKGHVVGLKEGETWRLVIVVRATKKSRDMDTGRATHVCAPGAWEKENPSSKNRLSNGTEIAVLPPEWAENQTLAVIAEEAGIRFDDWEDLKASLAPESQAGGTAP